MTAAVQRRGGRYPGYAIRPFGSFHLAFGGVDEFVLAAGAERGVDVAGTIACWTRVPATAAPYGIFAEHSAAGNARRYVEIQANGALLVACVDDTGATPLAATSTTTGLDDNAWHLIVWTERSDRLATLYIDGVRDAAFPVNWDGAAVTVDGFALGRRPTGAGGADRYLVGDIAHAAVWTRELTFGNVTELYNNGRDFDWRLLTSGRPRNEWWFGEDDTLPTLTDRGSGAAVNATATNMEAADVARGSP